MAAEVCPVLPKLHPTRNLQTMGSTLWAKFEKECPFAKVVQKNFGESSAKTKAAPVVHINPLRMYSRSVEGEMEKKATLKPTIEEVPKKQAKAEANSGTRWRRHVLRCE